MNQTILLFILLAAPFSLMADENFIMVSGEGIVSGTPDKASVHFSIETLDLIASKAQKENAQISQQVLSQLRSEFKLKDSAIQTIQFRVGPRYQYKQQTRVLEGYEVVYQLKVSINQIDQLGRLLDHLTKNKVEMIHSVQLEISDTKALEHQALELAFKDAQAKAQVLARASGKKLGGTLKIMESGGQVGHPMPMMKMRGAEMMASSADTSIEVGEQQVSANASFVFELN